VAGDSTAGKSRSAFEVARQVFPERRLIVPTKRESLKALLTFGVDLRDAIIWLDDLDNYLSPEGLSVDLLDRILAAGDGSVTVLATMRAAAHEQYSSRADVTKPERKVLERAYTVRLRQRLGADERARAQKQFADERLNAALDRFGLGEYLAAGPEIVDRFENSSSTRPIGHAIVRAVVDWRRVGLSRPIPHALLRTLHTVYLGELQTLPNDQIFNEDLLWAEERIYATSALLP
jgi:hypothetical protein